MTINNNIFILYYFIFFLSLNYCKNNLIEDKNRLFKPSAILNKGSDTIFDTAKIYGTWEIIRFVPGPIAALTEDEAKSYLHKKVQLYDNLAVLLEDSCKSPAYNLQKVNADKYFDINHRVSKSLLNIESSDVEIISLTCKVKPIYYSDESPSFSRDIILRDDKTIIIPINGCFFYLNKLILNKLYYPAKGDTVKCLFHEGKTCTGFVIQGTRKAGNVIHVRPINKDLPLEIDGQ